MFLHALVSHAECCVEHRDDESYIGPEIGIASFHQFVHKMEYLAKEIDGYMTSAAKPTRQLELRLRQQPAAPGKISIDSITDIKVFSFTGFVRNISTPLSIASRWAVSDARPVSAITATRRPGSCACS